MKLRLLSVIFALVVPLVGCNNNNSKTSTDSVQSSTTTSAPSSATQSPTATASPSSATASPTSETSSNSEISKNWYSYSSSKGNYTAKFPEKPNEQERSNKSQQGSVSGVEVRYVDNANQRLYLTGHVDLPIAPKTKLNDANLEKILDGFQNAMVKTVGATGKNPTKITQSGFPAREFLLTLPGGEAAKARIIINPNNLKAYQAVVVAKDGKPESPEAQAFLDSLKIAK